MEFVIRKNATLPLLKMQVVKDGRGSYEDFMRFIETSTIYFSMQNISTGILKINSAFAGFVEKEFDDPNTPSEYYLYYRFSKSDTNRPGRYEESNFDDDLDYESCWVGKYQCCIIAPPEATPTPTPTPSYTPSPTPTPSYTPSPTPTNPCIEYLTDETGNYILTEEGDYIISDNNPCI